MQLHWHVVQILGAYIFIYRALHKWTYTQRREETFKSTTNAQFSSLTPFLGFQTLCMLFELIQTSNIFQTRRSKGTTTDISIEENLKVRLLGFYAKVETQCRRGRMCIWHIKDWNLAITISCAPETNNFTGKTRDLGSNYLEEKKSVTAPRKIRLLIRQRGMEDYFKPSMGL